MSDKPKAEIWTTLQNIDRRILYVLMSVVCIWALVKPMGLPISINPYTKACYDQIAKLQPGDIIYLGFEYSGATAPELTPAVKATAKLAFERGASIVTMAMAVEGPGLGDPVVKQVADQLGKVYGKDYVMCGYRPGQNLVLEKMASDFWGAAVGIDINGTPFDKMPMMARLKKASDLKLIFIYTSGSIPEAPEHIKILGDRFNIPILQAATSVGVPRSLPYLSAGQLKGLLKGMRGAAELEMLAGIPGRAVAGMDAQSLAHMLVIAFIIMGNVAFVAERGKGGRKS